MKVEGDCCASAAGSVTRSPGTASAVVWSLEESAALEMRLGELALERGDKKTAARFKEAAKGRQSEAHFIRSMLLSKQNSDEIFSE